MYLRFCNHTVHIINKATPVSTPYCVQSVKVAANQMSRLGEALYGEIHVYKQYTRHDHTMGNTDTILQYND